MVQLRKAFRIIYSCGVSQITRPEISTGFACVEESQLPSFCVLSSPHNHDEAKFFFQLKAHQQPFSALEKKIETQPKYSQNTILVNNLNMLIQTHRLLLTHIIIQLKDLVRTTVLYKMHVTIIHVPNLTSFLLSRFISYTQSLF